MTKITTRNPCANNSSTTVGPTMTNTADVATITAAAFDSNTPINLDRKESCWTSSMLGVHKTSQKMCTPRAS
eukprot:m.69463 g.69463  ORF g.69463 m.69463 type:complete len:72 (+) comp24094_c1_seq2:2461-2676(+)